MQKNVSYKQSSNKGFSLVEIVVIIAIMIVLLAILTPSILRYVENSRMQKDDSAMDEVCHGILLALSDSEIFDEAVSYSIPNNYVTYTDSSGVYGAKYTDEEFWAPDGSGEAVTITFNPDEDGTYVLANGLVNDMTYGNGSVADSRTAEDVKQCYFSEMGQQKLYHKVEQTIGSTFSEKSATYNNSSYTVFITFDVVNGIKRADVYGEWNGTNLDPSCPASLGSGTNSYTEDKEPEQTKTGGTTQSNFTNSDLTGSGGTVSSPEEEPVAPPSNNNIPMDGYVIFDRRLAEPRCHTGIGEGTNWDPHTSSCYVMEPSKVTWEELMMPETAAIHGYDVTKFTNTQIQNTAFWGGSNPIEVKVPEGIEEIWIQAFYGCSSLVKVELPASLREIGTEAFRNCYNLETIIFKEGLETIKSSAFNGCYSLTVVQLPDSVSTMESGAFYMNGECDRTQLTSVNIPKSLTVISSGLFKWDTKMTEVILHDNVKEIGDYAFMGHKYKSFTLPASIEKIGRGPWNSGSLRDLYYQGTKAQWAGIQKDRDWAIGGSFTVHCIDGDICRDCRLVVNEDAQWENHTDSLHKKAATCSVCGSLGYIFESHTPVAKEGAVAEQHTSSQHKKEAICSVCNAECYEYKSHGLVANTGAEWEYCSTATHMKAATCVCGQTGYVYESHTGGTATCQDKKLCEVCNEGYGYLVPHSGGTATCQDRAVCVWCNNAYGELAGCAGGEATNCQTRATCATCGNLYGNYGPHSMVGGTCSVCGTSTTVIESEHSPYPNNLNSVVLGTWDYSDAKSVTITITYQTESTSYDYVYLKTGSKYITTSGNISSSSSKFGGTSKQTKTFTVNALTGSVIFRTDSSVNNYYGVSVTVTPNY